MPLKTSWTVVVRVYRGSTIVARRLRERPDVLSDNIAAHIRMTTTACGAHSTIISGRYFRLNTPPIGRQPSTCVLTRGRSGTRMNWLLRPVASTSVTHTADDFSTNFTGKVDTIRATTATAPAPTIEHRQVPPLASFNYVTVEEVYQILRKMPNKQCELDPMPTGLVKELCDVLAPIITSMANASFTQGLFPDSHKHAVVRPKIKKPSLDSLDIKSYRPISNLSLISKTVERLVVNRIKRPCEPVWSVFTAAVSVPAAPPD